MLCLSLSEFADTCGLCFLSGMSQGLWKNGLVSERLGPMSGRRKEEGGWGGRSSQVSGLAGTRVCSKAILERRGGALMFAGDLLCVRWRFWGHRWNFRDSGSMCSTAPTFQVKSSTFLPVLFSPSPRQTGALSLPQDSVLLGSGGKLAQMNEKPSHTWGYLREAVPGLHFKLHPPLQSKFSDSIEANAG